MAKASPIKVSFNAGELSPYIDGRTDQAKYTNGCSIMENWLTLVQGPIVRRGGFRFVQEVKNSASIYETWLYPFRFNVSQSYQLEFGDHYVRFFSNRGALVEGAKTVTAITQANPGVVTSAAHGITAGQYFYMSGVVGMTQVNGGYFKAGTVTTNTIQLLDQDGNNVNTTAYGAYVSGGLLFRVYEVVSPYAIADLTDANGDFALCFEQSTGGDVMRITHTGGLYQPYKLSRMGNLNWTMAAYETTNGPFKDKNTDTTSTVYASAATGTGITITASAAIFQAAHVGSLFYIEQKPTDIVKQWEVSKAITAADLRRSGVNNYIAQNTATTGSIKPTHTEGSIYDGDTGVLWLYSDSGYGIVKITGFTNANTVTADVISRIPAGAVGSGNTTYRWAHALFSAVEGWPEIIKQHLERIFLFRGVSFAASASGDFDNFPEKIGGVISLDAGIVGILPSSDPAKWARSANELIVGTGTDVIIIDKITASDPLGPGNVQALSQNGVGSSLVEPKRVGSETVFVNRSGAKLIATKYDYTQASYDSGDLTVLSEHVIRDGIIQLAYAQEPYSIVWGATYNGNLVGFTFDRQQDVLSWHRHPVGGSALVRSVSCIPSPDTTRDDLWIIAKRTINGVTRRYVEFQEAPFDGDDSEIANAFYVDSGLTYTGPATTVITGLRHLIGQTVDILANGARHPQKVVSASGTVTLNNNATIVQVGLPCPARIRTMRIEAGAQLGTAQGIPKRIFRLLLRLYKTLGGEYGPDDDHMDPLIFREAGAPMDTPPAMVSGDRSVDFPSEYDTEGYIQLLFDEPLPATIISLAAEMEAFEDVN